MPFQQNLFENTEERATTCLEASRIRFKVRANMRIRKSRLVVTPEEGLVVEMPRKPCVKRAKKLIHLRKSWVLNALENIHEKQTRARNIKRCDNTILVFGTEKTVIIRRGQLRSFILETNSQIYLGFTQKHISKEQTYKRLNAWLKTKAEAYIPLRVRQLNRGRFAYRNVMVKDQKTIWGSCSADGCLNFNWRIIMAPKIQSDYIIYHELCHTRHLNHSRAYWSIVRNVCPQYDNSEDWFREFGFLLDTRQAILTLG